MQLELVQNSIVLVGAWNRAIFNPKWIKERLTTSDQIEFEVPINNFSLPPRLSFDGIHLTVTSDRLILSTEQKDDALLERLQAMSMKILDSLSHTPMVATGINFRFVVDDPSKELIGAFDYPDLVALVRAGAKVGDSSIRRTLTIADRILNLTLEFRPDRKIGIEFNYHRDTPSTHDALEFFKTDILTLKKTALELLSSAYQILEEGE